MAILTKKPIKIGNIFACKKQFNSGAEANVYNIECCEDVVLKIYRYHTYNQVCMIYDIAKELEKVGLGAKVLSDIIAFDYDIINPKSIEYDNYVYGFICEEVKVCTKTNYKPYSSYEEFIYDRNTLKSIINDVFDFDWWDNSDYNVGVNKSGDLVCIDTGIGFVDELDIDCVDCDIDYNEYT